MISYISYIDTCDIHKATLHSSGRRSSSVKAPGHLVHLARDHINPANEEDTGYYIFADLPNIKRFIGTLKFFFAQIN